MSAWIDAHVHALGGDASAVEELEQIETRFGYDAANFLSVEGMDDAAQNALAIAWKLNGAGKPFARYAFGGLHHRFAYDYAEELAALWAIGLDGLKMIENKPTERRLWGIPQDDPALDGLYGVMESLRIPLLVHVNDPRDFWDADRIPAWAREAGYFYGKPGFVSFETILSESLRMVEKHPDLTVCFAHFLFLSDDHDRLRRIMDAHPNLWLDVTAGTEMYPNFSENRPLWRRFFTDYADRILYGTDNCAPMRGDDERIAGVLNNLERGFFRTDGTIPLWDRTVYGLGLSDEVFRKLTHDNFLRFAGNAPRRIDRTAAAAYLERRLDDPRFRLTEREREIVSAVQKECLRSGNVSSIL